VIHSFASKIQQELKDKIRYYSANLASGGIKNMEDYREKVGFIRALEEVNAYIDSLVRAQDED
jgi:hypothetical protein